MFEEHEGGDGGASGGGEGDTIPKPVGLAEAAATASPNGDRARAGCVRPCSLSVRGLPLGHHLIDAGALDQAIEQDDEGLLILVGELIDLLIEASWLGLLHRASVCTNEDVNLRGKTTRHL